MSTKTEKRKRQQAKRATAAPRLDVNEFAAKQGLYERDGLRGTINRGGTPLARWTSAGLLSETQLAAIAYCIRLWERAGRHTKLVQDLLAIPGQSPSSGWAQQEALDDLRDLKARVPDRYWSVFENVCRFDEPAGTAGSKLASNRRSAEVAARTCVCFVADLIATWKRL